MKRIMVEAVSSALAMLMTAPREVKGRGAFSSVKSNYSGYVPDCPGQLGAGAVGAVSTVAMFPTAPWGSRRGHGSQ